MTATEALPIDDESILAQAVDPSWFVSPVQRIQTSGGTAPFFKLELTEEGLAAVKARASSSNKTIDSNYWIGKDLSHAADEKDFYKTVLEVRKGYDQIDEDGLPSKDITDGIGLLEAFMFDYLGVLTTKTAESDGTETGEISNLLVMRNMRNKYGVFRMLDLKIGEKTAQAGWKGKSRFRAMKHHLMDGLSNSAAEGYRLAGFNGCPEVFDSMDPLLDILATESVSTTTTEEETVSSSSSSTRSSSSKWKTLWGKEISDSKHAQAHRFMLNSLDGTGVFRYFFDLHQDGLEEEGATSSLYQPIEVAEMVAHELTCQMIRLAASCYRVRIPQKWIGSSVAVTFDSGFFPERSEDAEASIRSKVLCKIFDWGRSELLTAAEFEAMSEEDQKDREYFWELYKWGLSRLSYNMTRFYYHQFSKSAMWSDITIRVLDFDSMSNDDYIGKVVIKLPNPNDAAAVAKFSQKQSYKLSGMYAALKGSTLDVSVKWVDFPENSRLAGAWKVTIDKASNLPPMDVSSGTSDPYCEVRANATIEYGQHFCQQTCVRTRTLDPVWNETIDVPVCKGGSVFEQALTESGLGAIAGDPVAISKHLQWDKHGLAVNRTSKTDTAWWNKALLEADKRQWLVRSDIRASRDLSA